ncbi:leucine-rich repeat domain-containing protein [Acinetobacter sp. NIPH 1958]|uniref:leucine-rich repeat protein n=1 Tax=unclassified Acinetobacter TaxID=196816 RepID=UPI001F4BC73E|nr:MULTISPECIES: leucine-rich repeat domain-containing protein [unclassified Acinetobacter]MCH7353250.1 leucine-rich repeat domain-containing protein [Acinetobacter sp. NIPH 2023]MCH7357258.1 leucine-rich repeat domain-containing protein [Acinetobacter sp. NIPH 1958]MCH7360632.1 leucine-rich repeat domain-containing protein [Acinetobacter sp. NIPH 2024]
MATYTGTADVNGDFNISFGGNSYTSAQKVTVTAAKDGATKSIELFAPSDTTGGGVIQFSGTLNNFPANIGVITLSAEINGSIAANAFNATQQSLGNTATGLIIKAATSIGSSAFRAWVNATSLTLPATTLTTIADQAFQNWSKLTEILIPNSVTSIGQYGFRDCTLVTKITLGTSLSSIGANAFEGFSNCNEINCLRATPPTAGSSFLLNLKAACVIKVPVASLSAYQTASNWSAHASKMVGV